MLKKLPYIRDKVEEELLKTTQSMEKTFHASAKGQQYLQTLPAKGLTDVIYAYMCNYVLDYTHN